MKDLVTVRKEQHLTETHNMMKPNVIKWKNQGVAWKSIPGTEMVENNNDIKINQQVSTHLWTEQ